MLKKGSNTSKVTTGLEMIACYLGNIYMFNVLTKTHLDDDMRYLVLLNWIVFYVDKLE
jgi:hypothetical protein